jgi:single-strand DNA-binding protein
VGAYVNRVVLIGNCGADPKVNTTQNGKTVAGFSLAINRPNSEEPLWLRITAWGKLAEIVGQHIKKGTQTYVEGRLEENTWTTEAGEEKTQIQVTALNVLALDRVAAPKAAA